ncbi:Ferric reductase domain protein transmembrane component domain [Parafrankia sp. EUN1f]|nr:Ferric reductase domain protein transmembrane component domain [Parafrankia sp. EUN1f]
MHGGRMPTTHPSARSGPAVPAVDGGGVPPAGSPRGSLRASGWLAGGHRSAASGAVRLGLVLGGVAVLGMWWFDTAAGDVAGAGDVLTAMGDVSGLLAAYLVLAQLLLMARVPALERAVGFDRLAAWHRTLGTNVVLLVVGHVLLTVWGLGLVEHHQPLSELVSVVMTYPDMWKATIGTVGLVAVGVASGRTARARMSYEAWYLLHLTAYLAVGLAFFHQIATGPDFVGRPLNRALWIALYTVVATCLVVWRLGWPLLGFARHRMVVERVVPEAPGVVSVEIGGRDLDRLGVAAGQFLLWRFLTPGHWLTAHAYSVSAPPSPHRLRITVKDAGDHSGALARLRPGTPVLAEGPFGHFTADQVTTPGVLLVGAGSGIGPIRALAEELAWRGTDVEVIYRVRREGDLALAGELNALAAAGRLTFHRVVGSRRELGYDPLEPRFLAAAVPDVARREVFVCGPPGLITSLSHALRQLGVPAVRIHHEEFSLR